MKVDITSCKHINNLYFKAFNNKNLDVLMKECYNFDVVLKDWIGEWVGIDAVLLENKKFFENEFTITVENTQMDVDGDVMLVRATNDIVIEIGGETINAVDVILFDMNSSKIRSITAYKR
jgi:ketosteroid isomerase-like protein